MSRGQLKPEDFYCVKKNYVYLKANLEALDVVDNLFQHDVISLDDKEKIRSEKCKSDRNEVLLTALLHAGPGEAFNYFVLCLEEKYKHVLKTLNQTAKDDVLKRKDEEIKAKDDQLKEKDEIISQLRKQLDDVIKRKNEEIKAKHDQLKEKDTVISQLRKQHGDAWEAQKNKAEAITQVQNQSVTAKKGLLRKDKEKVKLNFEDIKRCVEFALRKERKLNDEDLYDMMSRAQVALEVWKLEQHITGRVTLVLYDKQGSIAGEASVGDITKRLNKIGLTTSEHEVFWEEYEKCL